MGSATRCDRLVATSESVTHHPAEGAETLPEVADRVALRQGRADHRHQHHPGEDDDDEQEQFPHGWRLELVVDRCGAPGHPAGCRGVLGC